jgi:Uma2 family endonuclease
MPGATQRKAPPLSIETFRGFVSGRPEEERWELIDGVAVMMPPPTIAHQQIASNLQRLLNEALEKHNPEHVAFQRVGLNLGASIENYDPEPDVVVIDSKIAEQPDECYAGRFYLAAEVVSQSDQKYVEGKRDLYKLHPACTCILTVQQHRCEVRVDLRTDAGWSHEILDKVDDTLVLADFGLRCRAGDLYRGTAIQPR